MKTKLVVYTRAASNNEEYYAKSGGDSELLLSHINGGERKYWYTWHDDMCKLAEAHGWEVEVRHE